MRVQDSPKIPSARHQPGATIEGVTVEPMVDRSQRVELILGAKRDATFGPIVLVGAGGTTAEVLGDSAIGLRPPPRRERAAC